MKYSIVIPTYNHCDDLLRPCIESILKYSNVNDIELIISANGCRDTTFEYLGMLKEKFNYLGLRDNLKLTWAHEPLGYARACNEGIKIATTDLIVLLNNDTLMLEQPRNQWLELLASQFQYPKCGVSCIIKGPSEPAGRDFAVFFCVMIHRKVFDKIGLISLDYGVGGGEDTDFCIQAEDAGFEVRECVAKEWSHEANLYVGNFPIYHKGEGTVHDPSLVPEWGKIFNENSLTLARKYNPSWYKWKVSNNAERGVFFKGDEVYPREKARYIFAANNLTGPKVLEIGCSSGFGYQFMPATVDYTGIDIDPEIIRAANMQNWGPNAKFLAKNVNDILGDPAFGYFDTIIAYETIEHIPNGLEIFEKLKSRCDRLFITVPYNEAPGQFSPHHHIHHLTVDKFPGCTDLGLLDINGNLIEDKSKADPNVEYNLVMYWDSRIKGRGNYRQDLAWLAEQHQEIYREVIVDNCYDIKPDDFATGMAVIDIGANLGSFSLLAGYMGASKVIAVEPIGDTFTQLTNNIQRSGLTNIIPKKNLVLDKKGDVHKISINENSGHNSMYNVSTSKLYEEVESTTLVDLIEEAGSDDILLKMDCEGAEYDIVMNATPEQMSKVSRLVIEIHAELHPVYKGFELLEEKLLSFGLKRYDMKQVFTWMIGPNGEAFDMKPIPYRIELWNR